MIAHGFVVVGLFFVEIIFRNETRVISEMGEVFALSQNLLRLF
jgi:hypothetical protein